jgi:DNA-directed RNA polymerase specialized sigma24 family protein
MRKSAVVNRTDGRAAEVALVEPESIATQWSNELRRNIRVYPTCNLLRVLLLLDAYTRTVLYAFLIKGWSSSRIAEHLDVSLIAIQARLENGREQLKRKLTPARLRRQ